MGAVNGHPRLAHLPPYECPPHASELPAVPPLAPEPGNRVTLGRFKVLNAFVGKSARLINTTAQAAWLQLWRDVQRDGLAKVSLQQIAERMGVERSTAKRAVRALKDAGLVTVVKQGTTKHGPSIYRVHGTPSERATRGSNAPELGSALPPS